MKSSLLIIPTLALALSSLSACGCSQEPLELKPSGAESEAGPGDEQVAEPYERPRNTTNPFDHLILDPPAPNKDLPEDPFFKEFLYPDSEVEDVKTLFGTTTVWSSCGDDYETVDAYYAKKFTDGDGKLQGMSGRYYRYVGVDRRERVTLTALTGGRTQVVIAR